MTTPMDLVHAALRADRQSDAALRAYHAELVAAELFLMLAEDPVGDALIPRTFDLDDGPLVLVFDTEDRLAAFAGAAVPYAAVSGRALLAMLTGQGVGIGVNFDVAPSAELLPADAVDWLAGTLDQTPAEVTSRPEALHRPSLSTDLVSALNARLARAAGLARMAWLAGVTHADGIRGHLLVLVDAAPGAEATLARAMGEAMQLSGVDSPGPLDILFVADGAPLVQRLRRVGLRFDLPQPKPQPRPAAGPPGGDPKRPPRLR
ncbi:MAG: SseB family protein [Alkalilacustris sp.]